MNEYTNGDKKLSYIGQKLISRVPLTTVDDGADWKASVDEHGTWTPVTKIGDDVEAQGGVELNKIVISTTAEGAPTGRTRTILFAG